MIKVVFTYEPEPDEVDTNDSTGLTQPAFEKLHEDLMKLGAEDIDIRKVRPGG